MSFVNFKVHFDPQSEAYKHDDGGKLQRQTSRLHVAHPSLTYLWTYHEQQALRRPAAQRTAIGSDFSCDTKHRSISTYLRALTERILHILNEKDYAHPFLKKHLSPDFSGKHDHLRNTRGVDDHLATWAENMKTMPDFHYEILDIAVEVHDCGKKATVWTLKRLSGLPPTEVLESNEQSWKVDGICKEMIAGVQWQLQQQGWMCMRVQMLQGVAEYE